MSRRSVLAPVIAALCIGATAEQAQVPPSNFKSMAFLVGSCWKGTFKGRTVTDEHCFDAIYDGKFIRDRHVVRGDTVPYEGQTMYAWNPQQKRIVYWYIARPGFYSTGYVQQVDSNTLVFVDDLHEAEGKRDLRTVWRRTGSETFTNVTEDHTTSPPKEMWSMTMTRSRPTPKGQP